MPTASRGGIPEIDRLVHEPARFAILAHLYSVESADFLYIRKATDLTKGNLSSHMTKLQDAGYIKIKKEFVGRKPHTMLSITGKGKKAFDDYRKAMTRFLGGIDG